MTSGVCINDVVAATIVALFFLTEQDCVQGTCSFPSSIRETWIRGRDKKPLTFTGSEVKGLNIKYNSHDLGNFWCWQRSEDKFVIVSNKYSTTIEEKKYYVCWRLVEVTESSYFLYELSDSVTDASYQGEPGIIESETEESVMTLSQLCNTSVDKHKFTTLLRQDAPVKDVSMPCPQQISAIYSYALCPITQLDLCDKSALVRVNYSMCPAKIFHSASGVLSCMGHVTRDSSTFLSLIRHDDGSDITCFKYTTLGDGVITGHYYTGDCSTTEMTPLTLTKMKNCDHPRSDNSEATGVPAIIVGVILPVIALVTAMIIIVRKKMRSPVSASHDDSLKPGLYTRNLADKETDNSTNTMIQKSETVKDSLRDSANGGVKDCFCDKTKDSDNIEIKDHIRSGVEDYVIDEVKETTDYEVNKPGEVVESIRGDLLQSVSADNHS